MTVCTGCSTSQPRICQHQPCSRHGCNIVCRHVARHAGRQAVRAGRQESRSVFHLKCWTCSCSRCCMATSATWYSSKPRGEAACMTQAHQQLQGRQTPDFISSMTWPRRPTCRSRLVGGPGAGPLQTAYLGAAAECAERCVHGTPSTIPLSGALASRASAYSLHSLCG